MERSLLLADLSAMTMNGVFVPGTLPQVLLLFVVGIFAPLLLLASLPGQVGEERRGTVRMMLGTLCVGWLGFGALASISDDALAERRTVKERFSASGLCPELMPYVADEVRQGRAALRTTLPEDDLSTFEFVDEACRLDTTRSYAAIERLPFPAALRAWRNSRSAPAHPGPAVREPVSDE